jgi:hypothetical protein
MELERAERGRKARFHVHGIAVVEVLGYISATQIVRCDSK